MNDKLQISEFSELGQYTDEQLAEAMHEVAMGKDTTEFILRGLANEFKRFVYSVLCLWCLCATVTLWYAIYIQYFK